MNRELDRRRFMRLSGMSLGMGALLHFSPLATTAEGSMIGRILHRHNGEAPGSFSIVQLSDTHVGFKGPPNPLGTKAFERAVAAVNALDPQPDLVLFTGDLTHDAENASEHAARMRRFREIASGLRVSKRFHVPGEHDAALDGGVLFREHFGETHYSFDHRGVHFIALDNVSRGKPAVGVDQLSWLRTDLSRYPTSAPIVVFTHRPLFDLRPDWEWFTTDGADVMNALAPYESVTVLYGHIHRHDHRAIGNVNHYAARSLIFAFPDPATTADKVPIPFDPQQPFRNLGIRRISADATKRPPTIGVDDIELRMAEISGTEGIQQILKGGAL